MTSKEAIDAIRNNYPAKGYSELKEALDMAIQALQKQTDYDMVEWICTHCKASMHSVWDCYDYRTLTCLNCGKEFVNPYYREKVK